MKLIKSREKAFKILRFKEKNINGDVIKTYEDIGIFLYGNIQPISEKQVSEEYGITLHNSYNIYTKDLVNILDRLFYNGVYYEVKLMKNWDSYFIYTVKEVENEF